MAKLNAKKPEVMQYGSVSVKCQSKDLLAAVKQEHTALGKAWIGLNQSAAKWGKLLYSCEAAWDGCEALERDLCGVEKWLAARGHPKDSQLIIVQHSEMQVWTFILLFSLRNHIKLYMYMYGSNISIEFPDRAGESA